MNNDTLIDEILTHFSSGVFAEEVLNAKKHFFEFAGVFDEDSSEFELKMTQFIDWYLFTRPISSTRLTPVQMVEKGEGGFISNRFVLQDIVALSNHRHSIFEFIKLKNADVYVKDLIVGEKIVIKDSLLTIGFEKDHLFEARLFLRDEIFSFGSAFCFHPPKATRYILKEAKRVRKIKEPNEKIREREDLIQKLFRMRYKFEQYKHLDIHDIYTNKPKLKI